MAEAAAQQNWFVRQSGALVDYFRNVKAEMDKVIWPSKEQARTYTTVVLTATVFAAVTMGVFDRLLGVGVELLFKTVLW